jgi:glycosyltransferase involved in cell wall biosynthesis
MVACGLPVIDFREGSAPSFFTEKEMIFIDSGIDVIEKKIKYYITHQDELNEMIKNSQEKIKSLSWEKSARQFAEVISSL